MHYVITGYKSHQFWIRFSTSFFSKLALTFSLYGHGSHELTKYKQAVPAATRASSRGDGNELMRHMCAGRSTGDAVAAANSRETWPR
jgi:hypothetical protein